MLRIKPSANANIIQHFFQVGVVSQYVGAVFFYGYEALIRVECKVPLRMQRHVKEHKQNANDERYYMNFVAAKEKPPQKHAIIVVVGTGYKCRKMSDTDMIRVQNERAEELSSQPPGKRAGRMISMLRDETRGVQNDIIGARILCISYSRLFYVCFKGYTSYIGTL